MRQQREKKRNENLVASCYKMLAEERKSLHKKRVLRSQDWFGRPTWPPFDCFGTQIWRT